MSVHVRIFFSTGSSDNIGSLDGSTAKDVTIGESVDIPAGAVGISLHETEGTAFRFGVVANALVDLPAAPNSHRWTTYCGEPSFAVSGPSVLKTAAAS